MKALKIVVIGDVNTGKTSIRNQYINKKFSQHYKSTIGADFISKETIYNGKQQQLQIWDTAGLFYFIFLGQERFLALAVAFYRNAHACVIVYDCTNLESFENIDKWIKNFTLHHQVERQFPILIVGNKKDLKSVIPHKLIDQLLSRWSLNYFVQHIQISAKFYFEVETLFNTLLDMLPISIDTIDSSTPKEGASIASLNAVLKKKSIRTMNTDLTNNNTIQLNPPSNKKSYCCYN